MPFNPDFLKGFDPSKPSIARVYDYFLGGKDNFAADRELAATLDTIYPGSQQIAITNRRFLGRAVTWAANQGIGQFLDLGSGLPTAENTHQIAQAVRPDARVVYVDIDAIAVQHAKALLAKHPGVVAVQLDLREAGAVLDSAEVREMLDLSQPCAVIFASVLHFLDPASACAVVAAYTQHLATGSAVIISVGHSDDQQMSEAYRAAYSAGTLYNHSAGEVTSFFGDLELVPPGVVPSDRWRGGIPGTGPDASTGPTYLIGAVARVVTR